MVGMRMAKPYRAIAKYIMLPFRAFSRFNDAVERCVTIVLIVADAEIVLKARTKLFV